MKPWSVFFVIVWLLAIGGAARSDQATLADLLPHKLLIGTYSLQAEDRYAADPMALVFLLGADFGLLHKYTVIEALRRVYHAPGHMDFIKTAPIVADVLHFASTEQTQKAYNDSVNLLKQLRYQEITRECLSEDLRAGATYQVYKGSNIVGVILFRGPFLVRGASLGNSPQEQPVLLVLFKRTIEHVLPPQSTEK